MNVSLTPELEKFVAKEVGSGLYQTASEVIRAGLRRLKEDRVRQLRLPETYAELETQLLESVESLDAGKGVNGEEVLRRLRKRMKETSAEIHRPRQSQCRDARSKSAMCRHWHNHLFHFIYRFALLSETQLAKARQTRKMRIRIFHRNKRLNQK
jgi:antitoxin ParD1/3/4